MVWLPFAMTMRCEPTCAATVGCFPSFRFSPRATARTVKYPSWNHRRTWLDPWGKVVCWTCFIFKKVVIYRFLVSNLNLVASLAVVSIVAEWRLGVFQTLHPTETPIAYWVQCDNVVQELDLETWTWNLKNECQYFNNWLNNVEDLHLWLAAYNHQTLGLPGASRPSVLHDFPGRPLSRGWQDPLRESPARGWKDCRPAVAMFVGCWNDTPLCLKNTSCQGNLAKEFRKNMNQLCGKVS